MYEGLTDRYLSDLTLNGRTLRHRTRYAIHAAACMHEGLHPDLLNEAGGWDPKLWTYAVSAVVLYTRAAADRLGLSVPHLAVTSPKSSGFNWPKPCLDPVISGRPEAADPDRLGAELLFVTAVAYT